MWIPVPLFLCGSCHFLGVPPAGIALLDAQGYAAVLTIEASDEPHGVLNFALPSRFVLLQEANTTIQLFINREFGSLGLYYARINTVSRKYDFNYLTYLFRVFFLSHIWQCSGHPPWLCDQGSCFAPLSGADIKPWSATCKAGALLVELFLWHTKAF